jgi:xanthine dehydrogenase YagR molybdenum-binding subunit
VSRIEGRAKVTGAAKYSADNSPLGMLHAVLVGAPCARGKLLNVDAQTALASPDVVRVLTRSDMPTFGPLEKFRAGALHLPLQNDSIWFEGEPVAIVLATTLEAAEAARGLVVVNYESQPPVLPGSGQQEPVGLIEPDEGEEPPPQTGAFISWPFAESFRNGDAVAALRSAPVRIDRTYLQPSRHHNPIETSGTVASWQGSQLTVWDSIQASGVLVQMLSSALNIDPADIRVISPHTGGGFGCKGWVWPHQILTAAAARTLGVPVKLHLRRHDQYTATGFQPYMTQTMQLGADRDGHLTALRHRVTNITGLVETYAEGATEVRALYACPVIDTAQHVERVSVGCPTPMRTSNEGCGAWALEGTMNELAHELGIDPLELRLRNYAENEPTSGRPWSSNELLQAYEDGARLFGWREREPGGRHDGPWLVGSGMATSTTGVVRFPGNARVRLRSDGTALIQVDIQDIGTGLQTVLTQIVADELELPLEDITVAWGDSNLPTTGPLFASAGTVTTGSAVKIACREVRRKLAERSDTLSVTDAIRDANVEEMVGEGSFQLHGGALIDHSGGESGYAMRVWGAVFVEVGVDPRLGRLRLRRVVGSYSAGQIMNAKTARSQMVGALTWAWGKATMERSEQDRATGRWLSKNFTGVHVPANADIASDITIHFVDEFDPHASAFGGKGIGELGAAGVDAAIADAVFDAIGVRMRELPITPKRILDALQHSAAA